MVTILGYTGPQFSPIKLPLTWDLVQGDLCLCHDMPHCCAGCWLLLQYIKYRGRNKGVPDSFECDNNNCPSCDLCNRHPIQSRTPPWASTSARIHPRSPGSPPSIKYARTTSPTRPRRPSISLPPLQIPAPSSSLTPAFNTMALSSISSYTPVEDDDSEPYFPNIREILDEHHAWAHHHHPIIPSTVTSPQSQSQSVPNSLSYLQSGPARPITPSSVPNLLLYLQLGPTCPIAPSQSQLQPQPQPLLQSVPNSSLYLQLGPTPPLVRLLPEPSEPLVDDHVKWVEALSDAWFELRSSTIVIELYGDSPQVLGCALLSYLQFLAEHPFRGDEWVKPAGVAKFAPFEVSDLTALFMPSFKV